MSALQRPRHARSDALRLLLREAPTSPAFFRRHEPRRYGSSDASQPHCPVSPLTRHGKVPPLFLYMMPDRIAHYRIIARLGEGRMGVVYRAKDEQLHHELAIKLISGAFAQAPPAVKRFSRAFEIASGLNPPRSARCTSVESSMQAPTW